MDPRRSATRSAAGRRTSRKRERNPGSVTRSSETGAAPVAACRAGRSRPRASRDRRGRPRAATPRDPDRASVDPRTPSATRSGRRARRRPRRHPPERALALDVEAEPLAPADRERGTMTALATAPALPARTTSRGDAGSATDARARRETRDEERRTPGHSQLRRACPGSSAPSSAPRTPSVIADSTHGMPAMVGAARIDRRGRRAELGRDLRHEPGARPGRAVRRRARARRASRRSRRSGKDRRELAERPVAGVLRIEVAQEHAAPASSPSPGTAGGTTITAFGRRAGVEDQRRALVGELVERRRGIEALRPVARPSPR